MRGRTSILGFALLLLANPAAGFGNTRTHEELADLARERFEKQVDFDRYLIEQLGVMKGTKAKFALQVGFDDEIDDEIADSIDEVNRKVSSSRLLYSYSLLDRNEKHELDAFPRAPASARIEINLQCEDGDGFDTCFEGLARVSLDQLFRLGVWAEDNPNARARHHFHDPERSHAPPSGNQGLDNLKPYLLGVDAFFAELGTTALRGGDWLRGLTGLVLSPARPFTDADIGNFELRGRSAADRALDTPRGGSAASDQSPKNLFALPDAERYLFRALTAERKDEREHYLAMHFLAFGHVLHLLQDMGSAAHTRNDFINDHVLVGATGLKSLEDVGEYQDLLESTRAALKQDLGASQPQAFFARHPELAAFAAQFDAMLPLLDSDGLASADFWDQGAYDEPTGRGLAEVVHNNFFSARTVTNNSFFNGYALPRVPRCGRDGDQLGSGSEQVRVAALPERNVLTGESDDLNARGRFLSSSLVPHLARCRYHSIERRVGQPERPQKWWFATVIDESVQRDYLEILFALVVDYTSKFMESYFQPRIEVAALGSAPTGQSRFRIENRSPFPFSAHRDEIRIYYDNVDEGRSDFIVDCGVTGDTFTLAPATGSNPGGHLDCEMPSALPTGLPAPVTRGSFAVVIRGELEGDRGTVVEPSADWKTADFVTAVDHVRGSQIAFHRFSNTIDENGDGSLTDGEVRDDVFVVDFDIDALFDALDPLKVPVAVVNVTDPVRKKLLESLSEEQVRALDFSLPSADPDGLRITLAGDLNNDDPVNVAEPTELYIADLADPSRFSSPALPLPLDWNFGGGPKWNLNRATQNIVYTGHGTDLRIVEVDPSGAAPPVISSGTTNIFVNSAYAGMAVGVRGDLTNGNDVFIADIATGRETHRFNMGTKTVELCPAPPDSCPVIEGGLQTDPVFSPDGTKVAFVDITTNQFLELQGELFIADVADGGQIERVEGLGPTNVPVGSRLAWSQDGQWIAFLGRAPGRINIISASGGRFVELPMEGSGLTWLPSILLPE